MVNQQLWADAIQFELVHCVTISVAVAVVESQQFDFEVDAHLNQLTHHLVMCAKLNRKQRRRRRKKCDNRLKHIHSWFSSI